MVQAVNFFCHGKIITMIRKFFLESLVHSNKFQSSFLQCTSNLSLARLEGFKRLWNLEMNWKDWRDRGFGRDWTVCIGLESWECSFESLEGLHKFWELRESSFESLTCLHRFGELRECSFESLESAGVFNWSKGEAWIWEFSFRLFKFLGSHCCARRSAALVLLPNTYIYICMCVCEYRQCSNGKSYTYAMAT